MTLNALTFRTGTFALDTLVWIVLIRLVVSGAFGQTPVVITVAARLHNLPLEVHVLVIDFGVDLPTVVLGDAATLQELKVSHTCV